MLTFPFDWLHSASLCVGRISSSLPSCDKIHLSSCLFPQTFISSVRFGWAIQILASILKLGMGVVCVCVSIGMGVVGTYKACV